MNTVFTNMGAAYKIYDEAQRYKAAVQNGEKKLIRKKFQSFILR